MYNGIEKKIKMERKLRFVEIGEDKRIKIDFGFTIKEISLPLITSPYRDSTQSN